MYRRRILLSACMGCRRALPIAAARCPSCGLHVRASLATFVAGATGETRDSERRDTPHEPTA